MVPQNAVVARRYGTSLLLFMCGGSLVVPVFLVLAILTDEGFSFLDRPTLCGVGKQRQRQQRRQQQQLPRPCHHTKNNCDGDQDCANNNTNNNTNNNNNRQSGGGIRIRRRDFISTAAASATASILGGSCSSSSAVSNNNNNNNALDPVSILPFSSFLQYKTIVLPHNGLRVLLVHDGRLFQAQAALAVGGAGQWADPDDLPGCAHLVEHMVLSSNSRLLRIDNQGRRQRRRQRQQQTPQDFEEWLADVTEGTSNAFTAYDNVCFHFTCPDTYFQEGLERFARLFEQDVFLDSVSPHNAETLQREIQRVNAELDYNDLNFQATSLAKAFITPEQHPYGRFSAGNAETLQTVPRVAHMDVADRLRLFFGTKYQPNEAVLVVTAPQDLATLQKWVAPFGWSLSRETLPTTTRVDRRSSNSSSSSSSSSSATTLKTTPPQPIARRFYPGGFLQGSRLKQMVILHKSSSSSSSSSSPNDVPQVQPQNDAPRTTTTTTEPLQFEWILNLDYTQAMRNGQPVVTGTQIAFCLAQILGRRGPGSLYAFLLRRGWVPSGNSGVPRVSLPVDVSGFQIIKLEIQLTVEGFLERSAVVAAVYDSLEALRRGSGFGVARELVTQWASIAKLHGYLLTPRPPDAIELAQDVQIYGFNGPNGVGSGTWYRFPEPDDRVGITNLQKSLASTLLLMSDPGNALVIAAANRKMLELAKLPPLETSRRWRTEPLTGGRFLYDDMLGLTSRIEELVLTRLVDREELPRPVINPLVPIILKTPRPLSLSGVSDPRSSNSILPLIARDSAEPSREFRLRSSSSFATRDQSNRKRWILLEPSEEGQEGLSLPRYPIEPNYRSVFVVNLLSTRPARASLREAARGELFKISFEYAISDLAELGAPGGLAYDVSFNKYGMRLAFMGVNQNLPSYARRFCRRLVEHTSHLLEGPEFFSSKITSAAVASARRARFSQQRRNTIVSSVRGSTAYEAAAEGNAFLRSCSGAVCFAEGDWSTTREVLNLQKDLEEIFAPFVSSSLAGRGSSSANLPATPNLNDLIYKPVWKPRFGSPCALAGIALISDACGRVPR